MLKGDTFDLPQNCTYIAAADAQESVKIKANVSRLGTTAGFNAKVGMKYGIRALIFHAVLKVKHSRNANLTSVKVCRTPQPSQKPHYGHPSQGQIVLCLPKQLGCIFARVNFSIGSNALV